MDVKRTILVIDDNEISRSILSKLLSENYMILEAENGQDGLHVLNENKKYISLVLLDLMMPVVNGFEFMNKKREMVEIADIPVIVITEQEEKETELMALSLGAYDFLTKPYNAAIMKHRIANIIRLRETSTAVNTAEKDSLTGVYSKDFFYRKAEAILRNNIDTQYDMVCSDIEQFKLVNDLFGTKIGDELLKYTAANIKERAGSTGICGRIGPDTFVVLLPHKEYYDVSYFKEMVDILNRFPININLIIRQGIYVIDDIKVPVNAMCDRAKIAIESIKGRYEVYHSYYDDSIRKKLLAEQMITDNMKQALEERQFKIYYQPKYDLATECICGAEALVRWIHPEKGFMAPDEFIPLFEKNGFITDMDMYVWEEVCREIRSCLDQKKPVPPISVNMSRTDIYNPNITKILMDMITKYNLSPKHLHLEITETAYTDNPKQIIEVVSNLKRLGFIIEMDDFGTGYSSLNMLNELPIDILKLDRIFIQNHANNSKNILSFIISLAKWLRLYVVAEGVETQEHVKMLRNMDCDYAQGYYYAKPLPQEEFESLLNTPVDKKQKEELQLPIKQFGVSLYPTQWLQNQHKKLNMLLVDDLPVIRESLSLIFQADYHIFNAENGMDALALLKDKKQTIDIVLLDLFMQGMDGFWLLKQIKEDPWIKKIPVIVTSQKEEGCEARALSLGASDFISKPFNPEIVKRRIEHVMEEYQLREMERQIREHLEQKVQEDSLTGLLKRDEFEHRICTFFLEKQGEQAFFIMIDVDNFKQINDTLGHVRGDEILCQIADVLRKCFRQDAILSRMGGDEFAVFVPSVLTFDEVEENMRVLCQKVSEITKLGQETISCSFGVCPVPLYGTNFKTIYNNADIALLYAKKMGKNQYKMYGELAE